MTNNYKWDLSKLYTGYDDPIFLKDYDQLVNYKIENVNTNTSFKQLEEIKADGGTGYDKQHHVARRAGYGKDAGGGNAGHEPIP